MREAHAAGAPAAGAPAAGAPAAGAPAAGAPARAHSWAVRRWCPLQGSLANPLAGKELLARMRGPRTFIVATLFLFPLGGLALGLYALAASAPAGDLMTGPPIGKLYFAAVSLLELALICLLAPALSADLISGERERRTLDLLLVTPLSRRQIILGKLASALGSVTLLIVLALPIQALAVVLGGIGVEDLVVGLLILVLTAVTYGCVGLFWSARLRTTRASVLMAYATTLLGVVGLPLVLFLALVGMQFVGTASYWRSWPVLAPSTGDAGVSATPMDAQIAVTASQLVVATNPPLTALFSAYTLAEQRPLVFVQQAGSVDVTLVAPWLLFAGVHLLAVGGLIWLTSRALRRSG
ncbi:MAG: ABC transporter permease [Chloroflexi bacterium]|nr:ABC transporter permease [Chloroflexota bacterium]